MQKIRFHLANRTGTVIRGGVAVNAAGHDIANEKIIPVLFREKHICVASNPSQGSCLPFQGFHIRRKAHSHFLSPLRIIASAEPLIPWQSVPIRGKEKTKKSR